MWNNKRGEQERHEKQWRDECWSIKSCKNQSAFTSLQPWQKHQSALNQEAGLPLWRAEGNGWAGRLPRCDYFIKLLQIRIISTDSLEDTASSVSVFPGNNHDNIPIRTVRVAPSPVSACYYSSYIEMFLYKKCYYIFHAAVSFILIIMHHRVIRKLWLVKGVRKLQVTAYR